MPAITMATNSRAASAGQPALSMRDVHITYPLASVAAPAGTCLDVQRGDRVLLLGPSGCGKSTLALSINGLIPRTLPATIQGTITVFGDNVASSNVANLSCQVGMVFQDVDSQIVMDTVFAEVCFGPENLCLPANEIAARAEAALRKLGLWDKRCDDPVTLSGGEKQRLAIACALAMGSELLVLDEPTANLDPRNCAGVYEALLGLTADGRHAVLLIEHNIDAALSFVNRVVVLDHAGKTVVDGRPHEVFCNYGGQLACLGVRLPAPTRISLALRRAGLCVPRLTTTTTGLRRLLTTQSVAVTALLERNNPTAAHLPSPGQTIVELSQVTVQRGKHVALRGVSLQVMRGEFVGIIGENGAGKTTLLQTLAGLLTPASGSVRCVGANPVSRRAASRLGYVFQNPEHQFVTDTVRAELELSLTASTCDDAAKARRIDEFLERFGLTAAQGRHPFLLSGGEKRRLSVATALIGGAEILLLDEPTFGQDQAYSEQLFTMLASLHAAGTTIVVVAHDLELVATRTSRTVIMAAGRIVSDASTPLTFAKSDALIRAGLRLPALHESLHECGLSASSLARLVATIEQS